MKMNRKKTVQRFKSLQRIIKVMHFDALQYEWQSQTARAHFRMKLFNFSYWKCYSSSETSSLQPNIYDAQNFSRTFLVTIVIWMIQNNIFKLICVSEWLPIKYDWWYRWNQKLSENMVFFIPKMCQPLHRPIAVICLTQTFHKNSLKHSIDD